MGIKPTNRQEGRIITACLRTTTLWDLSKAMQFLPEALVLAASQTNASHFNTCEAELSTFLNARQDVNWVFFYFSDALMDCWSLDDDIRPVLKNTLGLLAVMMQDPDSHQILRQGECESALLTAKGIMPEAINIGHHLAIEVSGKVSFLD